MTLPSRFYYYLETALSCYVSVHMIVYGSAKYQQFQGATSVEKLVSQLSGMQLMWAFYGYSLPFAIIVGILEVSGGIMLLFRRTRLLGCLLLTVVLVNIILQDYFYEVHAGAMINAIVYQLCVLAILWINRRRMVMAFRALRVPGPERGWRPWLITVGWSVVGFVGLSLLRYLIARFYA